MPRLGPVTRYDDRRVIRVGDIFNGIDNNGLTIVLVHKEALRDMYSDAISEPHHEIGGYLIGFPALDEKTGINITYVEKAIRAIYDSSPSHITMHPVSFNEVENIRQGDGTIIVGWYHSHPGLGIFFSATDRKNHEDYHPEGYQIGIVIDPSKTPERDIESCSKWIGFFGWNNGKEIVQLPIGNVRYTEGRPAVVSTTPRVSIQQPEIKTTVAETHEQLRRILRESNGVFDTELPIVILPEGLQEELLRGAPSDLEEGLLFGETDRIAGYRLITVSSAHPFELDKVWKYLKSICKSGRQRSKLPDNRCVGIYLAQKKSPHFLPRGCLRLFRLTYRDLSKYFGDNYVVVMTEILHKEIAPSMWSNSAGKLLEIPVSQVITRQR